MPAKTLSSVLSQVVEAKAEYDVRLLAQQLGTNYRSLNERQLSSSAVFNAASTFSMLAVESVPSGG